MEIIIIILLGLIIFDLEWRVISNQRKIVEYMDVETKNLKQMIKVLGEKISK